MTLEEGSFKCLEASLPGSRISSQTWITLGTWEKHRFLLLPRFWVQCVAQIRLREFGFLAFLCSVNLRSLAWVQRCVCCLWSNEPYKAMRSGVRTPHSPICLNRRPNPNLVQANTSLSTQIPGGTRVCQMHLGEFVF